MFSSIRLWPFGRKGGACIAVRRFHPTPFRLRKSALTWSSLLFLIVGQASQAQEGPRHDAELRRQQEQAQALRRQQEATADVRLETPGGTAAARLPDESPCQLISSISWTGDGHMASYAEHALTGLQGDDPPTGRCLGSTGIRILLERATNGLIEKGFITSYVVAPTQDLKAGLLTLSIVPGHIDKIRFEKGQADIEDSAPRRPLRLAMAISAGDILNLRDVEQTLENLRRNGNSDADIRIEPGSKAGESDIVVSYQRGRPVHLALSMDDSGSKATGRWQANATLSWDAPLDMSDLFYIGHGQNIAGQGTGPHGTRSDMAHYALPIGYWLASATLTSNSYHQTVVGPYQTYRYSGQSEYGEYALKRVIHRGPTSKAAFGIKAFYRQSHNFIDDTEVEVQKRRVGGWEAEIQHTQYIGPAVLDATLLYRRGTGAFGASAAPEEAFGEGSSRMKLWQANLSASSPLPFSKLQYNGQLRMQWNSTALTPQDQLCIGGRYSVRGFDGEQSLCGNRGAFMRNEVSAQTTLDSLRLYGGFDLGRVQGSTSPDDAALAGVFLGIRWNGQIASYGTAQFDAFVGSPLRKPQGFETARTTAGLSLNASF